MKNRVEAEGDDAPWMLGVVAQDLEVAGMDSLVRTKKDKIRVPSLDEDGNHKEHENGKPMFEDYYTGETTKAVKYSILYLKAMKCLQEAMERIEVLESKIK